MSKRTINMTLSSKSILQAIKQLEDYKVELKSKTELFIEKLADIGITVAVRESQGDSHHFDKMVEFVKEWKDGYLCLIGRNSDTSGLHTEWYDGEGNYHDETISPILALEFGTAGLAIKGMKGTMAEKGTGNHIDDTQWFYYTNKELTEKHYATAEEPHQMMYKATIEMMNDIKKVAKEVWG